MDFIILKVNGVDVSTFSTEEASLAFQNAAEPIVVQVLRRSSNNESNPTSPVSSAGPLLSPKTCLAGANCCLHGPGNDTPTTTPTTSMATQTDWTTMADMVTDHVVVDDLDLLEDMYDPQDSDELFDELMDQEMEYEEVRLVRDNNQAKLGLTLCYTINCAAASPLLLNTDNNGAAPPHPASLERSSNSPNNESPSKLPEAEKGRETQETPIQVQKEEDDEAQDAEEDVYIKEIAPDSVAALDGRLKAGDQILQIDGEDVRNRATAERLFAAARSEILLLVSRPHQSPHPLEEALPGGAEDDEDLYFAEKSPLDLAEDLGVMESESHKDSGFGTGSLPQEEASGTSEGDDTGDKDISATQSVTDKPAIYDNNVAPPVTEDDSARPDSVLSLDTELYMLNKKMHDIQIECENMIAARQSQSTTRRSPPLAEEVLSPPSSPEKKPSPWGESETEHIYETIHELTEESDEPIYSTPYEVQIARQRALQRQQQLLLANLNSTNASRTSTSTKTRTMEAKKFTLDKKLSRSGFEKMDKTQDVEHWIRHATVNAQPCDLSAAKATKSNKTEDLNKTGPVQPTSPVKTCTGKSTGSKTNTNERSWKGTNSTKVSSSTSSSDSQYRMTGISTEIPKVAPVAPRGRKHGSKGSASSGSGEDRDSSSAYNTGTGESFRSGPQAVLGQTFEEPAPPRGVYDNLTVDGCTQCESNNKEWRQSNLSLSMSLGGRSEQHLAGKLFANFQLNSQTPSTHGQGKDCDSCVRCEPPTTNRVPRFVERKSAPTPRASANNGTVSDSLERNRNYVTMLPAHTMYTNAENLQQTIWLQQQLFKQTLQQQQQQSSQDVGSNKAHRGGNNGRHGPLSMDTIIEDAAAMIPPPPGAPPRSLKHGMFPKLNFNHYQYVSTPTEGVQTPLVDKKGNFVGYVNGGYPFPVNGVAGAEDLPLGMEWKVKKRTDGTRYITRKPARTRVLRDRALQINEERAGVTTDDDAMSEMKTGRYWSKDEKKQHLEKARERRKRQEEIIRAKMRGAHSYSPNEAPGNTAPRNINIVELSHRKMAAIARQRRDNQIDDFTTVQEMLVHGNRVGQGLLSVTTV